MGAENVGLREMVMTMSRLASAVNRNMGKRTTKYFLQLWILCKSQEKKFSHVVGRCEGLHLGSNMFLGPELSTKESRIVPINHYSMVV